MSADEWNERHPVGTPVLFWPGGRTFDDGRPVCAGRESFTRSAAWNLGGLGIPLVAVEGYPGGIALTHVEPREVVPSPYVQKLIADAVAAARSGD